MNATQARHPLSQCRFAWVEYAGLHAVIEPPQPHLRVLDALVQFGELPSPPVGLLLPVVENARQDLLQPFGLQQALLDMIDDDTVQLVHRDRAAGASRLSLPRLDRAGIVAILPALAGADRHRTTALGAEANAGQQRRPTGNARRRDLLIAMMKQLLHRFEGVAIDDRRNLDGHDLGRRLQFSGLRALVELVLAHIGAPGQHAVKLADAPASAVARIDPALVEVVDDRLHPHRTGAAFAPNRKAIDQPNRVGVQRVDLQPLLGLRPPLLGRDHAIADRRCRTIPEALPRILLQGAQNVLGVLLRLILVEQRHDLAHHDVHGIVAHLLRDGDELDAVLCQLPDVEFQLKMVAEEAAERMDDDNIERCGLRRTCLNHALEFRTAIVRRRCASFDESIDELVAA